MSNCKLFDIFLISRYIKQYIYIYIYRRLRWLQNIRRMDLLQLDREKWQNCIVCSDHFENRMFVDNEDRDRSERYPHSYPTLMLHLTNGTSIPSSGQCNTFHQLSPDVIRSKPTPNLVRSSVSHSMPQPIFLSNVGRNPSPINEIRPLHLHKSPTTITLSSSSNVSSIMPISYFTSQKPLEVHCISPSSHQILKVIVRC
jgi:hypothetical protein